MVRRGKVPKNTKLDYYTWKDFNIGIDIEFYGIVYHISDCDEFTKEFMLAQGVELNDSECQPIDPYQSNLIINSTKTFTKAHGDDDKLRRYLEFQGKVLALVLDAIFFNYYFSLKLMY